jgi:hypothetical protein
MYCVRSRPSSPPGPPSSLSCRRARKGARQGQAPRERRTRAPRAQERFCAAAGGAAPSTSAAKKSAREGWWQGEARRRDLPRTGRRSTGTGGIQTARFALRRSRRSTGALSTRRAFARSASEKRRYLVRPADHEEKKEAQSFPAQPQRNAGGGAARGQRRVGCVQVQRRTGRRAAAGVSPRTPRRARARAVTANQLQSSTRFRRRTRSSSTPAGCFSRRGF